MNESDISLSQEYARIQERVREKQQQHRRRQLQRNPREVIVVQQSPQPNQQLLAENESLKDYIEELCAYINDTSGRYSRNVEKLTKQYEQLYLKLADSQSRFEQQRLLANNQLNAERDMRLARDQEVGKLRQELDAAAGTVRDREAKIDGLKDEIEQKWENSQRQKQLWSDVLNNLEKQQAVQATEISELNQRLHIRNVELETAREKIAGLESELAQRYSLPEKIQSCERKIVQEEATIDGLREQLRRLEKQLDVVRAELHRANRQREELRIKGAKYEESFEVFFTGKIKQQEEKWQEERQQLTTHSARLKLQLEQATQQLQKLIAERSALSDQHSQTQAEVARAKRELLEEKQEKESYLGEFRTLKKNYEGVIRSLEDGFKELQQKNWQLEEQKRDLEEQVDKFRELVKELANINDFATAGSSEYYVKQIAKLQQTAPSKIRREDYILAREEAHREVAAERFNEGSKKVSATAANKFLEEEEDDTSEQWSKLIQGINSLKVSK